MISIISKNHFNKNERLSATPYHKWKSNNAGSVFLRLYPLLLYHQAVRTSEDIEIFNLYRNYISPPNSKTE